MKIEHWTHKKWEFWNTLGPFFASAVIRRELGAPMTSDDSTTWLIAFESKEVVGFAAVRNAEIHHEWLHADHRTKANWLKLLKEAKAAGGLNVTASEALKPHYEAIGFKETTQRGKYSRMIHG